MPAAGSRFPPTTSPSAAFAPPASGTSPPGTASSISVSRPPASRTGTPIWSHAPGNERSLKRLSSCQSPPSMMSTSPSVMPIDPRTASIFNAPWSQTDDPHGEQNGEQTEQNRQTLGSTKPNESGPYQPSDTTSCWLGAGRSQVQILSPR